MYQGQIKLLKVSIGTGYPVLHMPTTESSSSSVRKIKYGNKLPSVWQILQLDS